MNGVPTFRHDHHKQHILEKIMVVYIKLHIYSSNYPGDIVTSKQLSQNHTQKKAVNDRTKFFNVLFFGCFLSHPFWRARTSEDGEINAEL